MRKYPFAKLYLLLLLILACLSALWAIVALLMSGSIIVAKHVELSRAKGSAITVDTDTLYSQMSEAAAIARAINSSYQYTPTSPPGIALLRTAELRGREIVVLQETVAEYHKQLPSLKSAILETFTTQISGLEDAARSRLGQLSPQKTATPLPATRTRLYAASALSRQSLAAVQSVSQFLDKGVPYYTPSEPALVAAKTADANVRQVVEVYERDLAAMQQSRDSSLTTQNPTASTPKPQVEMIAEFLDRIQTARAIVHDTLGDEWVVELSLEAAGQACRKHFDAVKSLQMALQVAYRESIKQLLLFLGISTLLLVVRDFLSAAIDTAQNTGVMRDSLAGSDVKYE